MFTKGLSALHVGNGSFVLGADGVQPGHGVWISTLQKGSRLILDKYSTTQGGVYQPRVKG